MATISNGESGSSVRTKLNEIINKVEGVTSIDNDIDIVGTLTSDGLTVDGDGSFSGTVPRLTLFETDLTDGNAQILLQTRELRLGSVTDAGASFTDRFKVNVATGDISFYDDQGSSQSFFWDASAESLGIGTSSPSSYFSAADDLVVANATNAGITIASSSTSEGNIFFADGTTGDQLYRGVLRYDHDGDYMSVFTAATEAMRIDSSGNVGIGTSSTIHQLTVSDGTYNMFFNSTSFGSALGSYSSVPLQFYTNNTERMRIDSSGNVAIGRTNVNSFDIVGHGLRSDGVVNHTADSQAVAYINRETNDGDLVVFRKDNTTVGSIGTSLQSSVRYMHIAGTETGLGFYSDGIFPSNSSGIFADNSKDLGSSTVRFDDIYATNGTIQTSDQNEKQDIAELSDAEQRVAVAAKGLLRKFRWRDAVAEKGDDARTHFGIIAQDLQAAFAAEGLDAGDYAMFISSTWTDEETGEERTRMGVRYSELLAFIIAAI